MYSIIVHGGAGKIEENRKNAVLDGVKKASIKGFDLLEKGRSSLDAVEKAVNVLEDNPNFNAGTGSVLTFDGKVEMDAAIMYGPILGVGAIAGVNNVRNPVTLARRVMEETDHVLLESEGARKFARLMGFKDYDPITEKRRQEWKKYKEKLLNGEYPTWPKIRELIRKHPELLHGTVGAVAIDKRGNISAATSTGGVFLKLPGRVGDTPIPGAGTYATPYGGASSTGIGEGMMRTLLTKTVVDFIRMGLDAQMAARAGINFINNTVKLSAGVIVVDDRGNVGSAYNTPNMIRAYMKKGMKNPRVEL
ncbi:MAG: asparaginase [Thermotoga sp.]|nr:MAG: asparaginase [Thermotoga sp.]